MKYGKGISRERKGFFPDVIDDFFSEDVAVQFIGFLIDQQALKQLGFQRSRPASTDTPSYHPRDLLKLYINGYLNRIRSICRLEKESHRSVEVICLLRKLNPDFKTTKGFRKDNRKTSNQVFRRFTRPCKKSNRFRGELIAMDGSRFMAKERKVTYEC